MRRITIGTLLLASFLLLFFGGWVNQAKGQVGIAPAVTLNFTDSDDVSVGFGGEVIVMAEEYGWNGSFYRNGESESFQFAEVDGSVDASNSEIMTGPSFRIGSRQSFYSFVSVQGGVSISSVSTTVREPSEVAVGLGVGSNVKTASVREYESNESFVSPGVGLSIGILGKSNPVFLNMGARYFFQTENVDRFVKGVFAFGVSF